jgi:hypothetical protein
VSQYVANMMTNVNCNIVLRETVIVIVTVTVTVIVGLILTVQHAMRVNDIVMTQESAFIFHPGIHNGNTILNRSMLNKI